MKRFSVRGDVPMSAKVTRSTVAQFVSTVSKTICHRSKVMLKNLPHRRYVLTVASLLFSAILPSAALVARAETFNIVDYSSAMYVGNGSPVLSITGTLTTEGNGPWTATSLTLSNFTVTTTAGVYASPTTGISLSDVYDDNPAVLFTEGNALVLPVGEGLDLESVDSQQHILDLATENDSAGYEQYQVIFCATNGVSGTIFSSNTPWYSAPRGATTPDGGWIIGEAVPEPSTLVLLGVGAIGLLGYGWRRRASTLMSPKRSAVCSIQLLFAAVLLTSVSTARAENITYNLVDYPADEADGINGGTDTISGTIITDGTLGYLTTNGPVSQIIGGSLTFAAPGVTTEGQLAFDYETVYTPGSALYATPTQLIVGMATVLTLEYQTTSGPGTDSYLTYNADSYYYAGRIETGGSGLLASFFASPPVNIVTASYPYQWNNSVNINGWVIATAVPEPGTLALLCSGLLGLAVVYLRRRSAKA